MDVTSGECFGMVLQTHQKNGEVCMERRKGQRREGKGGGVRRPFETSEKILSGFATVVVGFHKYTSILQYSVG